MGYEKYIIKEFKHWTVLLHEELYRPYIGSTYLWAKRDGDIDIMEMTSEERDEFFEAGRKLKIALKKLFQPDRINYLAMANVAHHLHVHFIPRYANPKKFEGIVFEDKEFGAPPDAYRKLEVNESVLLKIRDALRKKI